MSQSNLASGRARPFAFPNESETRIYTLSSHDGSSTIAFHESIGVQMIDVFQDLHIVWILDLDVSAVGKSRYVPEA